MTMNKIFEIYTAGSLGFVIAVETHGGYEISRDEIERIGKRAKTAEDFQRIWENEHWWFDTQA